MKDRGRCQMRMRLKEVGTSGGLGEPVTSECDVRRAKRFLPRESVE